MPGFVHNGGFTVFRIFEHIKFDQMETYTVKIDKRTTAGKALSQIISSFSEFKKGIEITKEHTQADLKPEVLETFKDTDNGKGVKKFNSTEELFEDLGI